MSRWRKFLILLGEISQEPVSAVKTVRHVQCHILLVSLLISVRHIGIDIGALAAIESMHRSNALHVFAEVSLPLHKALQRVGHQHVNI